MKSIQSRNEYLSRNKFFDDCSQQWVVKCINHKYCKNGMPLWWMIDGEKRLRCMACNVRLHSKLQNRNSNY